MRKTDPSRKGFVSPLLKPSSAASSAIPESAENNTVYYFGVFWSKYSTKKNKATDDGYLVIDSNSFGRLIDSDQKEVAKARLDKSLCNSLVQGKKGNIGQYEFEINKEISSESWDKLQQGKVLRPPPPVASTVIVAKTPMAPTVKPSASKSAASPSPQAAPATPPDDRARAYGVFWCKVSSKMHKTYDDGFVHIAPDGTWTLVDSGGTVVTKLRRPSGISSSLTNGSTHRLSSVEMEIQKEVALGELPEMNVVPTTATTSTENKPKASAKKRKQEDADENSPAPTVKPKLLSTPFKSVSANLPARASQKPAPPVVVHADAFVLHSPDPGSSETPVYVPPLLNRMLRPHQREGVKFMYDCVMGTRDAEHTGCILADEMGLGKTLQSISLLWTMLQQGPRGKKIAQKVIVVCPAGLVANWVKEIRKWLTDARLVPLYMKVAANKRKKEIETGSIQDILTTFAASQKFPLLIVSYEQVRAHHAQLREMQCDLLICDEGHRLKNASSQVGAALNSLRATRRIILSGTPIQNDLEEFFCMMNFCCPSLLGEQGQFKRKFATPLQAAREPSATPAVKARGQQLTDELTALTGPFILRRTAAILEGYLPPKTEHVLLCRMTRAQEELYQGMLQSKAVQQLLVGAPGDSLFYINALRKICTHPLMVREMSQQNQLFDGSEQLFTEELCDIAKASGKFVLLEALLRSIRQTTTDKVLLVSNYTQTLDMLEKLCDLLNMKHLRIDGTTDVRHRTALVDRFNADPADSSFVLLLSAKAGGVGFNVVGANRLILFDPDWNPAVDRQVIGRVYREGQKKPVFIYRLLSTSTIEEKIFQRQAHKQGLSNALVDEGSLDVGKGIALELLRDLFSFVPTSLSDTHDQLHCNCSREDEMEMEAAAAPKAFGVHQLRKWDHLRHVRDTSDAVLLGLAKQHEQVASRVSFVFSTSNGALTPEDLVKAEAAEAEEEDAEESKSSVALPSAAGNKEDED